MSVLLRAGCEGILDYAGLFPPAKLSMHDALKEYRAYCAGRDGWIVNRFLCTAARLEELARHLEGEDEFGLGVIGSAGADRGAFQSGLESDARAMTVFDEEFGEKVTIFTYETRLSNGASVEDAADDLEAFDELDVFLELPWSGGLHDQLAELAEEDWLGAKGRTGGLEKEAFPSSIQLAEFLKGCLDLDLDFKLTAGLHQPLPHFDSKLGVHHHGFANILAALMLGFHHSLSQGEIAEVLESEEVRWSDGEVSWRGLAAGVEEMHEVRERFQGFGSCSVSEPVEGLRKMGVKA